jgi:hypothetical protein
MSDWHESLRRRAAELRIEPLDTCEDVTNTLAESAEAAQGESAMPVARRLARRLRAGRLSAPGLDLERCC